MAAAWQQKRPFAVASVGGGPGADLFGFLARAPLAQLASLPACLFANDGHFREKSNAKRRKRKTCGKKTCKR